MLVRMIYVSRAVNPSSGSPTDSILASSREHNLSSGIIHFDGAERNFYSTDADLNGVCSRCCTTTTTWVPRHHKAFISRCTDQCIRRTRNCSSNSGNI